MDQAFKDGLPERMVGFSTKMYLSLSQSASYAKSLQSSKCEELLGKTTSPGVFFIPSFPALMLPEVQKLRQHGVALGAQNCFFEDSGPFTGEVSPVMCKEVGCSIIELGHAERRAAPFNETDEMISKKAIGVTRNGMVPLVCIGEKERGETISQSVGKSVQACSSQIKAVLDAVATESNVVFAFEPVWAIGAKEPANPDYVVAVVKQLKDFVGDMGRKGQIRILYGGSAGPGTWEYLKAHVDGLFLGRFAHEVDAFVGTVQEVGQP